MLSNIVTVGPLLAGLAAITALAVSFTRHAVLRRRAETQREIMGSLTRGSRHHTSISHMHKATVSRMIARQAHNPWRFFWPWLVWLAVAGLSVQTGYYLARYLRSGVPFDLDTFAYEVMGGDRAGLIIVPAALLMLGQVFAIYEHSLYERARTARTFFNTGRIKHTRGARSLDDFLRERIRYRSVKSITPGLTIVAVGLSTGMVAQFKAEQERLATEMPPAAFWIFLAAVLLVFATTSICVDVSARRQGIENLPPHKEGRRIKLERAQRTLGSNSTHQRPPGSRAGKRR